MGYVFQILELQFLVLKLPSNMHVSLQFLMCQLMCVFFFFTSHNTYQLLKCACQLTCIWILCKFLRVKREKLANFLSNIYIGLLDLVVLPIGCPKPNKVKMPSNGMPLEVDRLSSGLILHPHARGGRGVGFKCAAGPVRLGWELRCEQYVSNRSFTFVKQNKNQ